jgi:predicted MFS family arabinose efflux permease
MAFQSLWIEGWMLNVDKYSQHIADHSLLAVGIGITVGVLSTGYIASFAKKLSIKLSDMLISIAILYLITEIIMFKKTIGINYAVWFLLGFLSHLFNLVFAIYANSFSREYSGRVNSAQNIFTYFVTFLSQYIMGVIIGTWKINNQQHSDIAYKASLSMIIAIQIIALLWFLFFKKIAKVEVEEITI